MRKLHGLTIYLLLVHVALALALWKPDLVAQLRSLFLGNPATEKSASYQHFMQFQLRADANLPPNAVLFFGDSHVHGLCVPCIAPMGANYGIGTDTAAGVLARIGLYSSVKNAGVVVLAAGYNDLKRATIEDTISVYRRLLEQVPAQTPVVVSALFPVDSRVATTDGVTNAMIRETNQRLLALCQQRSLCTYVNTAAKLADADGELRPALHVGDGVHLSPDGYAIWIAGLKAALLQN